MEFWIAAASQAEQFITEAPQDIKVLTCFTGLQAIMQTCGLHIYPDARHAHHASHAEARCWAQKGACSMFSAWVCGVTLFWISRGSSWSTVQPTLTQVPRISFTVPFSFRAQLRSRMTRAISTMVSSSKLPLCLMFFSCSLCTSRHGHPASSALCDPMHAG